MSTPQQIAEAFSSHRFAETYDHLADDVHWVLIGQTTIAGRAAVIQACEQTAAELADTTTEVLRFITIAGADAVGIDAVGRYIDSEGHTSVVSSCDIYEFSNGLIAAITSYATELDASTLGEQSFISAGVRPVDRST